MTHRIDSKKWHTHTHQYNYCIDKLGIGKVLTYMGIEYGAPRQQVLFSSDDLQDETD